MRFKMPVMLMVVCAVGLIAAGSAAAGGAKAKPYRGGACTYKSGDKWELTLYCGAHTAGRCSGGCNEERKTPSGRLCARIVAACKTQGGDGHGHKWKNVSERLEQYCNRADKNDYCWKIDSKEFNKAVDALLKRAAARMCRNNCCNKYE